MELRHVEHVHLAHQVKTRLLAALLGLFALRLVAAALLPLSADEAYYWLWSRHLAAGYFDHPPAIAWVIRAGTFVFGQTEFGVRVGGILLSFAASWLIYQSGRTLLDSEKGGALACLLFNLTLMTTVETLVATPDTPQIFAAALFFWTLTKVQASQDGRWWLAVGLAGGLGLLSKYSTLFLGVGVLFWLLASRPMRRWLGSPWPYLGGLFALAIFAPNLMWNAEHGWATFAFQFGRIEGTQFTLKYLGEFVGAQAVLASPFILVLGLAGLMAVSWRDKAQALIAALVWPSLLYFLIHALHDRVQGNWPCYLYPMLAVAAAGVMLRTDLTGWRAWSKRLAIPVAAMLLVIGYAQALFGVIPFGRKDPLARLLAVGLPEVVSRLETLRATSQAGAVVTTDYATTAWLAFYSPLRVVSLGEDYRWPNTPAARFPRPALYLAEERQGRRNLVRLDVVQACFAQVSKLGRIDRLRRGVPIAHYVVYRVAEPKGQTCGRMP